jgi:outer membrane murein-binding lipoprotein Lpp
MRRLFASLALLGALGLTGCASMSKKPEMPDSAAATVSATADQLSMGKFRAEAIASRRTAEEIAKNSRGKPTFLAVRTLGLTPEQAAMVGTKVPDAATALVVVLWDPKTENVVGTDAYVVKTPGAPGELARFGAHTARYVGSL